MYFHTIYMCMKKLLFLGNAYIQMFILQKILSSAYCCLIGFSCPYILWY